MPEEPWSDWVSSTSRRSAGSDELDILDIHDGELFQVIKASLVDDLPEKLIRRLSTILFKSRHVDIIDKHDHFSSSRGS